MASRTEQDRLIDHHEANSISRREAIRRVSALLGGIGLVGGHSLLTGCTENGARHAAATLGVGVFTPADIAFLDEIAETILPETHTPGAKAAEVGAFMALMVTDVYSEPDQGVFGNGMRQLEEACRQLHSASFMEVSPSQRLALLEQLDREQKAYMDGRDEARRQRAAADQAEAQAAGTAAPDARPEAAPISEATATPMADADAPTHYFRMMKELTLLGYFTSEIGYTQAMRYEETPGRFDPCVSYSPGDRAWAPHA